MASLHSALGSGHHRSAGCTRMHAQPPLAEMNLPVINYPYLSQPVPCVLEIEMIRAQGLFSGSWSALLILQSLTGLSQARVKVTRQADTG